VFASLDRWLPAEQVIHIVLSGPSVATLKQPGRLFCRPSLIVNGAYRMLAAESGVKADLYLISDVGFIRRQWDAFIAGTRVARALAIDHRVALEIARRDPSLLRTVPVYLFDNLTRPYGRPTHWWRKNAVAGVQVFEADCALSLSADVGYFPSRTVAYIALQIAASQRPQSVTFFGLDLGGSGRFYAEAKPEQSMLDQDRSIILRDLSHAVKALTVAGIDVFNASLQSTVPDTLMRRIDPDQYLLNLGGNC